MNWKIKVASTLAVIGFMAGAVPALAAYSVECVADTETTATCTSTCDSNQELWVYRSDNPDKSTWTLADAQGSLSCESPPGINTLGIGSQKMYWAIRAGALMADPPYTDWITPQYKYDPLLSEWLEATVYDPGDLIAGVHEDLTDTMTGATPTIIYVLLIGLGFSAAFFAYGLVKGLLRHKKRA